MSSYILVHGSTCTVKFPDIVCGWNEPGKNKERELWCIMLQCFRFWHNIRFHASESYCVQLILAQCCISYKNQSLDLQVLVKITAMDWNGLQRIRCLLYMGHRPFRFDCCSIFLFSIAHMRCVALKSFTCNFTKSNTPHGCFSCFFNFTMGTRLHNLPHMLHNDG